VTAELRQHWQSSAPCRTIAVMNMLGHADLATKLRTYAHRTPIIEAAARDAAAIYG
jgi:hypothetical protein